MHLNIVAMPIVPLFLFKLSVSLAAVWCFYQFALRRLTFHMLNRWYLLGYALLSFVFPLINIGPMLPDGPVGEPAVLQFIPAMGGGVRGSVAAISTVSRSAGLSVWTVILSALTVGSALLVARVIVRWLSLVRLRGKARLIAGGAVKIYQVDGPVIPFSFGNAIYINQQLHTEKEWEDIILHEYVHIRQRHTVDILIAELVCIVNWYNPFAWLIRYSIRQNLEFIADQQVLDKGVDRKGYQYHLLKVMGEPRYRLANNFNFSSLKKRIIMMNKMRSAKVQLLKLLFLLPLAGVLLVAFRNRYDDGMPGRKVSGQIYLNVAGIIIVLPDRTPIGGVAVRDEVSGVGTKTDERGFYRLRIPAMADSSVDIHLNYYKEGYDSTFTGWSGAKFKETTGILELGFVIDSTKPRKGGFMGIPDLSRHPIPAEPGYEDAVNEMNRVFDENDRLQRYMQLQKDHPDIGLFYRTEDCRKEIVIYLNGTIEKYGYPGTPGVEELYKKYGKVEGYMASDHPEGVQTNPGYLARWAAIGEQAQRDFHTTNPNVRAVIFPGDSRVIGVPVSGKPKFYDMDNDAAVERTEFERLYGKLPDCVPKAGNNTDERKGNAGSTNRASAGARDTVPGVRKDTARSTLLDVMLVGPKDTGRGQSLGSFIAFLDSARGRRPLLLVDGRKLPKDTLKTIYTDQIESMNVLKDSANVKKYGEEGKDGVLLITLKDQTRLNAMPYKAGDTLAGNKRPGN